MSGTDDADDMLHSESSVQDTVGTTVKGVTGGNMTAPNTDVATDGIAAAIPREAPAEDTSLVPDLDASSNAVEEEDGQNDAVVERDDADTGGADTVDALHGAELGSPQQEGRAGGIHDVEGGIVDDDSYARVRAAALDAINEVSATEKKI